MDMDTRSVESFFTTQSAWSSVPPEDVVASSDRNHSHQLLDLDALQVALTELDHSPQKDKSWISRQLNRRLPSRGSARSSTDSVQLLADQQEIERTVKANNRKNYQDIFTNRNIDYVNESVAPKVVNISIHVEGEDSNEDLKNISDKESLSNKANTLERRRRDSGKSSYENLTRKFSTFSESSFQSFHSRKSSLQERSFKPQNNNSPAQSSRLQRRSISSIGGSSPLLRNTTSEAEQSYWKIKDEITKLASKRRSSGSISASCVSSEDFTSLDPRPLRKESLLDTSAIKESEENRSSSEADVVISDRESIASSGTVNRRTVIRISEKSKSAASLISESSASLLSRDQDSRRSLRSDNNCRIIPIELDPDFEGGINVSIVNQQEPERRDSTSRMYVRQSDSENRPSRASAFNVRRTIEKRQIQQERRERKALRDQIREQLRSLSESRSRKDSTSSHTTNYSQSSIRSKSLSSLDQDLDDFRCESPLTKVQSSPTLEKEKDDVRSYLFETNLTSPQSSQAMSPTSRDSIYSVTKETYPIIDKEESQEDKKTAPNDPTNKWSFEALKAAKEKTEDRKRKVSKSYDSVQDTKETSRRSSFQSSVPSLVSPRLPWQDIKLRSTPQRAKLIAQEREEQPTPQQDKLIAEEREEQPVPQRAKLLVQEREEPIYSEIPGGSFKPENKIIHNITVETEEDTNFRPTPPPRRNRLTRSTGQLKLESEDKPTWVRLAKERRSLRSSRQVDQLSDRASTASKEPEWVAQARKKLENLNVCLTSTTDFNSVCSQLTESSAWSRGGLDALDEIKEETKRIGEELAEEANARVDADLGIKKDTSKMLEYKIDRSREPSAERLKVSFEVSNVEKSDSEVHQTSRKSQKDEVRFGDLKHDWGGVQNKTAALGSGKQKEMRFGEVHVKETSTNDIQDKPREMRFGEYQRSKASPPRSTSNSANNSPTGSNVKLPVMHFGDTPLNLFPSTASTHIIPVQSSSKFESIAGPDPMGMTAEQLNQNVEEYDFPIPTGKEDTTEFLKMLEEDLKKVELVPEFVCNHDSNPKPKSILKRRSVENVLHELKKEEKSEWLQKVDHRKSASFDWDTVDNKPTTSSSSTRKFEAPSETSQSGFNELQSKDSELDKPLQEDVNSSQPSGKVFTFTFNSDYKTVTNKSLRDLPEDNKSKSILVNKEDTNIQEGLKRLTIVTNPNDVVKSDSTYTSTIVNGSVKEHMRNKSPVRLENRRNKSPDRIENMKSKSPIKLENMANESTVRLENMRNKYIVRQESNEHKDIITTNQSAPEIPPRNHRIPLLSPKLINRTVPVVSTKSVLLTNLVENHTRSSSKSNITEEPPQNQRISLLSPKLINKTVPEVSTKSPLMKSESHNHSLSNRRINKAEEKSHNNVNNDIQQVTIEIVDEETKKRNLKKKEQESRNNSLAEWEAIQRQKIEEEEKNRINKHLSMKPVSTKIKELVFNVFSKEKKTDINGTVDGKEDIVFRKVSTDNTSDNKPSKIVETIHPLKSAFIVNKMMAPLKSQSSHKEGSYNRSSRKSSSTDTSLEKSSRSVSDDRKTESRNIKIDSYNRKEDILSTKSSHKNRKNSQKESKLINKHSRSSFDSENSSLSHKNNNTSSPDRRHKSFNASLLDDNENAFNTNETPRASLRDVKRRLNFENCDNTPKKENKDDLIMDERTPKEDLNSNNKLREFTISNEEYSGNQHSNIKDPKARQEWLNKMLSTLDSDNKSQKTVDITADSHKLNVDTKDMKYFNKKSQIISRESNDKGEISQPNSRSLENRKNIVNKSSGKSLVKDPVFSDLKTNINSSSKNYSDQVKDDPILDTFTQSKSSEEIVNSVSSFSAETASSPKPFLTKHSPRISHTTELGTSLSSKLQIPLSSLSNTSSPSTSLLNLSSPSITKKPSSYSSLRSSLQDVSESTSRPSKRGPVSLFSIIGETSSRSSSQASTPITSPRATPERIIKKDSIEPPKLDIIPESKLKSSIDKNIEKENIAPIVNGFEESSSSEDENQEFSNFDDIPRYSFRLRNGYEDNSKVNKEEHTESSDLLQNKAITSVEYGDEDKANQLVNSWKPSSYKPFNFGKPSLTLKAMTSDVDTERVSTSKIINKNRSTEELQPQISQSQKMDKPITENHQLETLQNKEEMPNDKKSPFSLRFANHRSSLRGRVPTPAKKGSKDLTLPNKLDFKDDAKESFASRFSTERSSLRKNPLNETTKLTDKSSLNENALSDQTNSTFSRFSSDRSSLTEKKENVHLDDAEEPLLKRLGNIEHRKNSFATRFNTERSSLRGRKTSEDNSLTKDDSLSKTNNITEEGRGSFASRFNEERNSQRLQERTGRLSPDHVSQPVSLSSILLKDVDPKDSHHKDSSGCQFKPRLSFSDELKNMSEKYSSTLERQNSCESLLSDDSLEVESKETSPEREMHVSTEDNIEETLVEPDRKLSDAPSLLPKSSTTPKNKGRNVVVRRNSSLKRHRSNQPANSSTPVKKERKSSEESNPGDVKSECIMQDQSGRWVKTKTTVRRSRLNSGGSDKSSRSITRTNSGRGKEKTFKKDAAKDLEAWAANTTIQGKIMKKEGQRFSHETTEETNGGQVITKSVGRRMIRRGSRRMSGGGEMLTETKETSTTGNPSDPSDPLSLVPVTGSADPNVSRKMKTATDGEHYMTQSVSNRDGREIFSTEGVNNKTTTSEEVIGGDEFEAKRQVTGKTGHRVVVEQMNDNLGRPSTTVKKITTTSKVTVTKAKRKAAIEV